MGVDALLVLTILIALGFDFTNGFHDTANAVATSISTRALGPRAAVGLSAVFNLVGALVAIEILHTHVANTIGGLVSPHDGVSLGMIIAALVGAIVWNLVTWRLGLPSSSSHALIGALIGMGVVAYGVDAVKWGSVLPVVIALVASPVIGLVLSYLFTIAILDLFRRSQPSPMNRRFRLAQLASGAFVSFSHGANDAQKTMGVITLALVSAGTLTANGTKFPSPPLWVVLLAATAIGLGTYAGGWRIIRTLGTRWSGLSLWTGSAPRRWRRWSSRGRRNSPSRSVRPTLSRVPSWAPAPHAGWAPCVGAWHATFLWRGC